MSYEGSYISRLRQKVGSDLVVMPGSMTVLRRADGRVLLARRSDDGTWCLPGGHAEPGGSFALTAIAEVAEEVGVRIEPEDLTPFATLSEADKHTVRYANGDVNHCFAVCFLVLTWTGDPAPHDDEVTEVGFFALDSQPQPMHPATQHALDLLIAYETSGRFQVA